MRTSGSLCRISALSGTGLLGIATARTIGSKPARNKVKRRVREAARLLKDKRPTDLDWIVIVPEKGKDAKPKEIAAELELLMQRIRERWEGESGSF